MKFSSVLRILLNLPARRGRGRGMRAATNRKSLRGLNRFQARALFASTTIITLVAVGVLDGELGDKHTIERRRGKFGFSIFVSSIDAGNPYHSVQAGLIALASIGVLGLFIFRQGSKGSLDRMLSVGCSAFLIWTTIVLPNLVRRFLLHGKSSNFPHVGNLASSEYVVGPLDSVNRHSHLWHKPNDERIQVVTDRDKSFPGPVPDVFSGAQSTGQVQITRQLQLASGYTYWQNMYLVNRSFVFVQGLHRLDITAWAIMSESESRRRWGDPGRYASHATRGFHAKIVGPSETAEWNWTAPIAVEHTIMITDFIPKFTPHLYHMLENLIGIWATIRAFRINASSLANEPKWLLLPQNVRSELKGSTRELISLMFPGITVVDRNDFRRLSPRRIFYFSIMVASDRSAADHGGVNQMMTGILSRLPHFMPSMVTTVLRNVGWSREHASSAAITVTFVDRQASQNRRLGREHSKNLLWLLGTADPRIRVHWTRFELLSLREQILKAAETDVLVGVHGNGLSHVLWIRKPGALVEILPGRGNRLLAFQQFCEIRGLLYYGIETSSGVVYREGSCTSHQQGNRWYPPEGCTVDAPTINQIATDLDLSHIVCLVYDALYNMQKIATDPRLSCGWPSCAVYLGARENATRSGCLDGREEYECTDLGPSVDSDNFGAKFPNGYCHDLSKSVAYCPPGMFLCKAHSNPGWRLFLKGLHTWQHTCEADSCFKRAKGVWKGFLLNYGFRFAVADVQAVGHKLCVLLPYQDGCQRLNRARIGERAAHLQQFLIYMQDFLVSAGHSEFDFVVVVQTGRGLFNKGALYNIGANVAVHRGCDFAVLHDIDHLPMDHRNNYSWPDRPIHLCTNSSDLARERSGGAVLMQLQHFALINGLSNRYNGREAEYADLHDRMQRIFGGIARMEPRIGYYWPTSHATDVREKVTEDGESAHAFDLEILEQQRNAISRSFMDSDGYMQMRSHLKLVNVSQIDNILTVTVDVLKDGMRQQQCA
jgi:hypothetical protein